MTIRSSVSRLALAAVCAGAVIAVPMLTAPPAAAACNAGQVADPYTGICWSQSRTSLGISGTGGTCLPGRLGLCLGALQNSQIPGDNLPDRVPGGASPRPSWP